MIIIKPFSNIFCCPIVNFNDLFSSFYLLELFWYEHVLLMVADGGNDVGEGELLQSF